MAMFGPSGAIQGRFDDLQAVLQMPRGRREAEARVSRRPTDEAGTACWVSGMPIAVLVTAGGQHQRRHALLVFHVYLRAVVRQEPDNRIGPAIGRAVQRCLTFSLVAFTSSPASRTA